MAVLGRNPADSLAGGEGKEGEGHKERERDLRRRLGGAEADGGGPALELCSRRRRWRRSGEETGARRGRRAPLEGVEAFGRVGS